jgi:hypothetical protein
MAIYHYARLRRAAKHQESSATVAMVNIQTGGDCGRGVLPSIALTT